MKRKNVTTYMMKQYISESLLILMAQKEYRSISINEITDKAGVNRSTYYRNFSSKEDIIKFYFSNIMQEYLNDYSNSNDNSFENYMLTIFRHFYKYKKELLIIYESGLAYLILEVLNYMFEESKANTFPDTQEKYRMYFHAGGIFNFFILWFSHGMKESPKELTQIALSIFPSNSKPELII